MENDLISRSALKKALLERSFFPAIVKAALENAPAVDAVEVVRCKDCNYLRPDSAIFHEHCGVFGVMVAKDDFCSFGKRRADDEKF